MQCSNASQQNLAPYAFLGGSDVSLPGADEEVFPDCACIPCAHFPILRRPGHGLTGRAACAFTIVSRGCHASFVWEAEGGVRSSSRYGS
jgi:hypothetical protein